jgi:hypothetical protein
MVSRGPMEVTRLDGFLTCDKPLPYRYVEGFEAYVVEDGARVLRGARIPFMTMSRRSPPLSRAPSTCSTSSTSSTTWAAGRTHRAFFDNLGKLSVNELNSNTIFFTLDQETVSKD